ncbi:kinase-like protein [Linderina pennispora]|uniref:non-specific serine/threonine protein kinase n=1 Tax=Linderina pennispora TaxID=61395 RepID=A0A1Y1WHD0_9FUNG|nr:kinase-like protein [Linderina pennispora]ORX72929.1 kinase-like protein [Linderina pennispora]
MRTIIESDGRLVDFGSRLVMLKMYITSFIYLRYPKGEYTFRWPMRLTEGIHSIPQPTKAGFENIHMHIIKEEDLTNKKLLRCFSGTLTFRAEYQGRDVFVKYARDEDNVLPLIAESLIGMKFLPRHSYIQEYLGVTANGLVSEYFDGKELPIVDSLSDVGKSRCFAALKILHDQGIVHGDLGPQNIMVNGDEVKLIDFSNAYSKKWNIDRVYPDGYEHPSPASEVEKLTEYLKKLKNHTS